MTDIPAISVQEARDALASDAPPRLIDVREPQEWEVCHIQGAELLPLSQWPALGLEKLTSRDEPLIIQCHHGGRSAQVTAFLLRNGFTQVKNLSGGIEAWAQEIDPTLARY